MSGPSSPQSTSSQEPASGLAPSPPSVPTPIPPSTQKDRTTLCGAHLQIQKSSIKGRYSVTQPCTLGGIILIDNHPYALLPAKVFLPPVAYSSQGLCCDRCDHENENDYKPDEEYVLGHAANTEDILDETGKARRNCDAIDRDAEFVVTFIDASLRSLSRVVRIADHQRCDVLADIKRTWKACYVNLDYGWALIEMADVPETLLINQIWDHGRQRDIKYPITRTKYMREAYPERHNLRDEPNMFVTTPRNSPQTAMVDKRFEYMYLAGTGKTSCKKVLALEYEYAGMGDNGSWLVDPSDSQWWGMIITKDKGKSYAILAQAVMENIQKTMGAWHVTLPTPGNDTAAYYAVSAWRGGSEFGSDTETTEEMIDPTVLMRAGGDPTDDETIDSDSDDEYRTPSVIRAEEERASAMNDASTNYVVGEFRVTARSSWQTDGN
ncbi:hypothetical protein H2200_004519 [Cladophialophora chaetospira]|uniref:Uncharacterized protein n=1 Tax=Cladophialophora chaetospira TaxID=386627 RepID=A0AA38XDG5_9EURO|nr:hypothetical protein H2200_004519 [Cladophialophora chaetospira]